MALNGRLDEKDLAEIKGTNRLIRADLVDQVNAWRQAFQKKFGKPMIVTDAYRKYNEGPYSQVSIFEGRYTPQYLAGRPRKWYQGRWWYQRPYTAMAAVPGTSNHGWATAIDFGSGINNGYSDEWAWAVETAPTFGFRWPVEWARSAREWWHFESDRVVPVSNYISVPGVSIDLSDLSGSLGGLVERDWFDMATEEDLRRIVAEEVSKRLDERQARNRKDMLEQSGKANDEVIAELRAVLAALPEQIATYTDGNKVLPGKSGQFYVASRDNRVISRRVEELVKEVLEIVRPLAPTSSETDTDDAADEAPDVSVDVAVTHDEGDTPERVE